MAHAAREPVPGLGQIHQRQGARRLIAELATIGRRAEEAHRARKSRLSREPAILGERELREDVGLLVAAANAAARDPVGGEPRDLATLEPDRAGARRKI